MRDVCAPHPVAKDATTAETCSQETNGDDCTARPESFYFEWYKNLPLARRSSREACDALSTDVDDECGDASDVSMQLNPSGLHAKTLDVSNLRTTIREREDAHFLVSHSFDPVYLDHVTFYLQSTYNNEIHLRVVAHGQADGEEDEVLRYQGIGKGKQLISVQKTTRRVDFYFSDAYVLTQDVEPLEAPYLTLERTLLQDCHSRCVLEGCEAFFYLEQTCKLYSDVVPEGSLEEVTGGKFFARSSFNPVVEFNALDSVALVENAPISKPDGVVQTIDLRTLSEEESITTVILNSMDASGSSRRADESSQDHTVGPFATAYPRTTYATVCLRPLERTLEMVVDLHVNRVSRCVLTHHAEIHGSDTACGFAATREACSQLAECRFENRTDYSFRGLMKANEHHGGCRSFPLTSDELTLDVKCNVNVELSLHEFQGDDVPNMGSVAEAREDPDDSSLMHSEEFEEAFQECEPPTVRTDEDLTTLLRLYRSALGRHPNPEKTHACVAAEPGASEGFCRGRATREDCRAASECRYTGDRVWTPWFYHAEKGNWAHAVMRQSNFMTPLDIFNVTLSLTKAESGFRPPHRCYRSNPSSPSDCYSFRSEAECPSACQWRKATRVDPMICMALEESTGAMVEVDCVEPQAYLCYLPSIHTGLVENPPDDFFEADLSELGAEKPFRNVRLPSSSPASTGGRPPPSTRSRTCKPWRARRSSSTAGGEARAARCPSATRSSRSAPSSARGRPSTSGGSPATPPAPTS